MIQWLSLTFGFLSLKDSFRGVFPTVVFPWIPWWLYQHRWTFLSIRNAAFVCFVSLTCSFQVRVSASAFFRRNLLTFWKLFSRYRLFFSKGPFSPCHCTNASIFPEGYGYEEICSKLGSLLKDVFLLIRIPEYRLVNGLFSLGIENISSGLFAAQSRIIPRCKECRHHFALV